MKISVESDYAIRMILYLFKKESYIFCNEIVSSCKVPERMGMKILTRLANQNILKSVKGKKGGFKISENRLNISLYDIIKIFDDININICLNSNEKCSYKNGECVVCEALKKVKKEIIKNFSQIYIENLWRKQQTLENNWED